MNNPRYSLITKILPLVFSQFNDEYFNIKFGFNKDGFYVEVTCKSMSISLYARTVGIDNRLIEIAVRDSKGDFIQFNTIDLELETKVLEEFQTAIEEVFWFGIQPDDYFLHLLNEFKESECDKIEG